MLSAAHTDDAFRAVVDDHRPELHAHCYRMLGSVHDAEDALQETLLRAWRGLPGFTGRSSLRVWLYRIATNACLDLIARRSRRVLPVDYGPATDPMHGNGEPLLESIWLEPYPDEALEYERRESVELAFVASLQHLSATQRAVLIMRDVLGFSAREVSESLDTTVVSVNSALQRARRTVSERLPERSQQETLSSLGDERARELVQAYLDAWASADVERLRGLLAEDAVVSMPPWPAWWQGRETIARFSKAAAGICRKTRAVPARANGQTAVASYGLDPQTGRYMASAIDVYTFEGASIKAITAFVMPELFPRFGLPPELASGLPAGTARRDFRRGRRPGSAGLRAR